MESELEEIHLEIFGDIFSRRRTLAALIIINHHHKHITKHFACLFKSKTELYIQNFSINIKCIYVCINETLMYLLIRFYYGLTSLESKMRARRFFRENLDYKLIRIDP